MRHHLRGRHTGVLFEKLSRGRWDGLYLGCVPLVNILSAAKALGVRVDHGQFRPGLFKEVC